MLTLEQLHTNLLNNLQDGSLTLTSTLIDSANIIRFLTSLPEHQLVIQSAQIQRTADSVTVTGIVPGTWSVSGLSTDLTDVQTHLSFTPGEAEMPLIAMLQLDVNFVISGLTLPLTGSLNDQNNFTLVLNGEAATPLTLRAISDDITGGTLTSFLPLEEAVLDMVQIVAVQLAFSFDETFPTHLSVTSEATTHWEVTPDLIALDSVGITLSIQHANVGEQTSRIPGGVIHAVLTIGGDPFYVAMPLRSGNLWELRIIPGEGNILPGLAVLAEFIGGVTLRDTVQAGLNAIGLGEITVDGVNMGVDLNLRTLSYVSLQSHLNFLGAQINLYTRLPEFSFGGGLAADSQLTLSGIIRHYFGQADNFAEIVVDDFSFSASPNDNLYTFRAVFAEIWSFDLGIGSWQISEVELGFVRTLSGIASEITGRIHIAGIAISLSANQTEPNAGWQFAGLTGRNQQIPIGHLMTDLVDRFGDIVLPAALNGLTVENLGISFNTATRDFTFTAEGILPIEGQNLDITLTIDITRQPDGSYRKRFSGRITINTLQFDLLFVQDAISNHFVAAYSHTGAAQPISVHTLVAALSDAAAAYIPTGLEIDLRDVLFAYQTDGVISKFLLAFDVGAAINLSQLPLVGPNLPAAQTISVDKLQIVAAAAAFTQVEIAAFNNLLPPTVQLQPQPVAAGFNLAAAINFGGTMQMLNLPVAAAGNTVSPTPVPPMAANITAADNAHWFTLQKAFGPLYFERIGVQYQDATIAFLLDAALAAAGLTLSLDGLAVRSPLNQFALQFDLRGLGIDYRSGPLEIGGAFLRQRVQTPTGETYDEYDGQAVIKSQALTLSAIGSYARLDGHPSLFIYAVLDYPLGGPAFFFVTGLAAGFGYNRTLRVPAIDQIAQFPLVAEAINNPGTRNDLTQELQSLRTYIPIGVGDNFLAVGIKFSSFKIIDSFVLVTVAFGRRFELDILGLSTLIVPTPEAAAVVTPLAEVQMALKASFIPDEGFLGVSAQLTNASYILSRNCHLTGGFAFYSWFSGENAGEFVQTLGGYHPRLRPPAHYPQVPRLGFNWMVNSELNLKGQAYYALTPSTLMAGGRLEATWRSGDLQACFVAAADFLLAWQPYHYEARVFVDIAVAYTFRFFGTHHVTAHLGADLQISGPEFSGQAHVQWSVISFDVTFGRSSRQRPQPISWETFQTSFLPDDPTVICSLSVQEGLVRAAADGETVDWILNPKTFTLLTNTLIPSAEAFLHTTPVDLTTSGSRTDFGIGPMAVTSADLITHQTITITREGEHVEEAFALTPVLKAVPVGLWGQELSPALNGPRVIKDTLAGFTITPQHPPAPGVTEAVDRGRFQFATTPIDDVYGWAIIPPFAAQPLDEPARRQTLREAILAPDTITARDELLAALGFGAGINLNSSLADAFVIAPQIAS